jgi:FdhE protein
MTKAGSPGPEPGRIRTIPEPPFVRLPDPAALFARRAGRFRSLADRHDLAPYLRFLAGLADAQAAVQHDLPAPEMPAPGQMERAARHAMPPLDRAGFAPGAELHALIDRLAALAGASDMPAAAAAALGRVAAAAEGERAVMVGNVLADAIPFEAIAEHAFVAAALQVHFTRLAGGLEAGALKPVGDGVCPACGGAPSASLIVGWPGAEGTRFCACSLCAALWNYVRAKCTLCGSTASITLREVEGGPGLVKAEVCGACAGYVKVLYQAKEPALDPIADDVASLGLDMLVREQGFRRGGVNPFLVGY